MTPSSYSLKPFQLQVHLQLWAFTLMNMDAWFHGDNKNWLKIGGLAHIRLMPNTKQKAGTQVSANRGYTNTCKHTSNLSLQSGMCWSESYTGHFSLWPSGCMNTALGEMRPDGDRKRRNERKWRKKGANKQNKLSKALCWAGAGTGVGVYVYVRRCEQSGRD